MSSENEYVPMFARIAGITEEAGGKKAIQTFTLQFVDPLDQKRFSFRPGQCVMVGQVGYGESMFAISSSPLFREAIQVSVMRHGKVTSRLHELQVGDVVSVRGPYGNWFPLDEWEDKNLLFVGGGIGQAPLRSVINFVLDERQRKRFGKVDVVYGANEEDALCYMDELGELSCRDDVSVHLSVDCSEEGQCSYFVGFVPDNLMRLKPRPEKTIAVTCGPPVMIRYVVENLVSLGFEKEQIFTTLEQRMKCGIGKCGRCNIGGVYVCRDGPVFSAAQIDMMQGDF